MTCCLRLLMTITAVLVLICSQTSCSNNSDIVPPNDKLCRAGAGLGARVSGTPAPIDICVSDDDVSTTLEPSPENRYRLRSTFSADSLTFEIEISFTIHFNLPQPLNISSDSVLAMADLDGAWFFYREAVGGSYSYVSKTTTGSFVLTFADETVAVGTLEGLTIDLEDETTGAPAGTRTISEGFFNVLAPVP